MATRPLVTADDCIPSCSERRPHERWECRLLATTPQDWERIMSRPGPLAGCGERWAERAVAGMHPALNQRIYDREVRAALYGT